MTPRMPSRFLAELVPGLADGQEQIRGELVAGCRPGRRGQPMPAPDVDKPTDPALAGAPWPVDPLGGRRTVVEAGAALVDQAMAALPLRPAPRRADAGRRAQDAVATGPSPCCSPSGTAAAAGDRRRAADPRVRLPAGAAAGRPGRARPGPAPSGAARAARRRAARARRSTPGSSSTSVRASILDVVDLPGCGGRRPGRRLRARASSRSASWPASGRRRRWSPSRSRSRRRSTARWCAAGSTRCSPADDGGVDIVDWKTGAPPDRCAGAGPGRAARGLPAGLAPAARRPAGPHRRGVLLRLDRPRRSGRPTCSTRPESIALLRAVAEPGGRWRKMSRPGEPPPAALTLAGTRKDAAVGNLDRTNRQRSHDVRQVTVSRSAADERRGGPRCGSSSGRRPSRAVRGARPVPTRRP